MTHSSITYGVKYYITTIVMFLALIVLMTYNLKDLNVRDYKDMARNNVVGFINQALENNEVKINELERVVLNYIDQDLPYKAYEDENENKKIEILIDDQLKHVHYEYRIGWAIKDDKNDVSMIRRPKLLHGEERYGITLGDSVGELFISAKPNRQHFEVKESNSINVYGKYSGDVAKKMEEILCR